MTLGYSLFFIFTFGIYVVNMLLIARAWGVRKKDEIVNEEQPSVTVLVPAYNEGVGIVDSIKSLLAQDYPRLNIVVVNDGSTDRTGAILANNFADEMRVTYITQENKGKAAALNRAAELAEGDLLISVDADTILHPMAVSEMVSKLKPDSDAMAIMIGIHNGLKMENGRPVTPSLPHSVVTRIQWLEYVKSYVIFRCSLRDKNALTVISGACGLIRKEMFHKCGGFKGDQLGEDMELTLNIHAQGGKIQFLPQTMAWTEAPETVKDLGKQRVRWYRGAIQALIKHKGLLFKKGNKTLNWFLLPYIWISDVVGVWVEAVSWIFLSYLLFSGGEVAPWYFLFIIAYYINTLMIVAYVKASFDVKYRGTFKALLLATIEGLGYHFLFLFWSLKAQTLQIFGAKNKWNKLERTGAKI